MKAATLKDQLGSAVVGLALDEIVGATLQRVLIVEAQGCLVPFTQSVNGLVAVGEQYARLGLRAVDEHRPLTPGHRPQDPLEPRRLLCGHGLWQAAVGDVDALANAGYFLHGLDRRRQLAHHVRVSQSLLGETCYPSLGKG